MMLQVLYSVRSERQLVEQINYNLLFRWFVGLSIDDSVWIHSVFSKNRERMIDNDIAIDLFNATVDMASFLGHVTTDNRHGLVVNVQTTKATGTAERDAAAEMLGELAVREKHITVGADKAYDTQGFVQAYRAIDGRTTRHVGYEISQRKRKCIEQCFGSAKVVLPSCFLLKVENNRPRGVYFSGTSSTVPERASGEPLHNDRQSRSPAAITNLSEWGTRRIAPWSSRHVDRHRSVRAQHQSIRPARPARTASGSCRTSDRPAIRRCREPSSKELQGPPARTLATSN